MSAAIELLMQLMGSTFRSVKRTDVIAACDLFVPELLVKTSDTNVPFAPSPHSHKVCLSSYRGFAGTVRHFLKPGLLVKPVRSIG